MCLIVTLFQVTYCFLVHSLPLQLFDLVYREETLLNVIKSVTRNGRSIVLTAVLALILVYLFSIVGYIFFKDDFILAVDRIPNKTLGRQRQCVHNTGIPMTPESRCFPFLK